MNWIILRSHSHILIRVLHWPYRAAIAMVAKEVNIIGYDGYKGEVLSEKEMELTNENKTLFEAFKDAQGVELRSLTPSLYKSLKVESIYQFL